VGDASYKKDPITGQGISDAFQDAEELVAAVRAGLAEGGNLDAALAEFAARRDERALDSFDFTRLFARLELADEYRAIAAGIAGSPAHTEAFLGVLAGSVSLSAFASPETVDELLRAGLGEAASRAAAA
jgi:2-polyprenyl-6-methoxyphenol hydroxylase-like FAD-dependent oxidoreductase